MTRAETFTKYFLGFLTIFVVIALYAPIVLTIFYSFYKTRKGKVDWDSFSYEPYTKLIFEKQILESLVNSVYTVFFFTFLLWECLRSDRGPRSLRCRLFGLRLIRAICPVLRFIEEKKEQTKRNNFEDTSRGT